MAPATLVEANEWKADGELLDFFVHLMNLAFRGKQIRQSKAKCFLEDVAL